MAETKKYLDLTGLAAYDEKIKGYIDAADAVVQGAAASDAASKAEGALTSAKSYTDTEVGKAKSYTDEQISAVNGTVAGVKTIAEQGVADAAAALVAAQGAQSTADGAVQKIGELPTDSATVVAYINKKTEGIATEGAMTELAGRVTQAEKDIDAIEADYLKAQDKQDVMDAIDDAVESLEAADAAIDERLVEVETFFKLAEGEQLDGALDTLVEIQQFLSGEGGTVDQLLDNVAANAAAIEAEAARAAKAEGDLKTAYEAADTLLDGRVAVLEAAIGDEGSVEDMIDAAVADEAELRVAGDAAAEASAAAALAAAQAADGKAVAADGRVAALETVVAGKVAQGDHDALAGRVTTAEGKITTLEGKAHENHANRETLDKLTAELMAKLEGYDYHTHANKAILDNISQSNIDSWNAAEGNAKAYADGKFVWAENAISTGDIDSLFA